MKKNEFLRKLREFLSYELPGRLVEKNINYYREYIEGEVNKGTPEGKVLDELGDPQLIARTIIDAAKSGKDGIPNSEDDIDFKKELYGNHGDASSGDDKTNASAYAHDDGNYNRGGNYDRGYDNSYQESDASDWKDDNQNQRGTSGWYIFDSGGCLSSILLMLIAFTIFSLLGSVIGFLRPVLVPIFIVLLIAWLLSRRQ